MGEYRWLTELSRQFLERDYLVDGQTVDERVDVICNAAEKILNKPGFAAAFKDNIKKGWYSLSSPVWTNFGTNRGLPISCFGSTIIDSMESILYTQAEIGMMTKHGGGTSAYFGNLRGRGEPIRQNGESSGSVHFMQLFETSIQVISQGSCYVEGTEVLTNNGFKDFRDITKNDKLAEIDEKNVLSFTDNYKLIEENFTGNLKCFKGRKRNNSVSLKVTPDHRMVVQRLQKIRRKNLKAKLWVEKTDIVKAKDLCLHRDNRLILSAITNKTGHGLTIKDKIRIAYQADGIKDGDNRKIRFHFSKKRKIERLKWLLEQANINYESTLQADGTTEIKFGFDRDLKYEYFAQWVQLEDISKEWAEEFVQELVHWDGTFNCSGTGIKYHSTVKENVDFAQAIASICGKQTKINIREASESRKRLFVLSITDKNYKGGDAVLIYDEPYNGKVYCATVPKGRLLVRHNGRTMVCGNSRRGQFAAYLPVDHKDINEFLTLRSEGSPIQDLSFGVCVSDAWMQSMIDGDKEKRKIWAKVLESRAHKGYPYIFFTDNANKGTVDVYKDKGMKITHSNLCSEIFLPDNEEESFVCDLSSMNLLYYDEWKDTNAVELIIYFLDAVMTEFINKAKNIKFMERPVRFAERHRALGLGVLGWHSYLQSKMIPYESMDAKYLNVAIAKNIKEASYKASAKLAQEYGEPELMKGYGRRNSTTMAIAPTKSSAFILGQVSEQVEPHRANIFIKDLQKGKFTVRNPHLETLLEKKGKNDDDTWMSILKMGGSVQHLDFLNDHEKAVFKTFSEISMKEVIIQAAQRQKYLDQGQSLNIMIHPEMPIKEVNNLIIEAWKLGIKSFYYQYSINAAQKFSRELMACKNCEG